MKCVIIAIVVIIVIMTADYFTNPKDYHAYMVGFRNARVAAENSGNLKDAILFAKCEISFSNKYIKAIEK